MALIVDNNPNPSAVQFDYQSCSKVYWDGNLVWPDLSMLFWIRPEQTAVISFEKTFSSNTGLQNKPLQYTFDGVNYTSTST